ncbi:MAG: hypothetical protein IJO46_00425 [Thermoguttaceae bacterium]|nr:hypothetical protein [Thermoguttaceae bacterium]MBQ7110528.1 hypothetical protein [Thermoguttaceae bacterium]
MKNERTEASEREKASAEANKPNATATAPLRRRLPVRRGNIGSISQKEKVFKRC